MSDVSDVLLRAMREARPEELPGTRLATLTGGTADNKYVFVQFDGESVASTRPYPKMYAPVAVGDRVVMLRVGSTWVALSRIPTITADLPDTDWIPATLQNGFTNLDTNSWDAAGYRRLNGWTCLRGMLSGGTRTGTTVIFNVPAGFRIGGAAVKSHVPIAAGTAPGSGSPARINVHQTTGDVSINDVPAGSWLSLSYVSWPVGA